MEIDGTNGMPANSNGNSNDNGNVIVPSDNTLHTYIHTNIDRTFRRFIARRNSFLSTLPAHEYDKFLYWI